MSYYKNVQIVLPFLTGSVIFCAFSPGSLNIAWRLRTVLWNRDSLNEEALNINILQHYSTKTGRALFLTNWKSAGRAVICSDLETIKQVLRSYHWVNRVEDDHYIYVTSFRKPLGIMFGNGAYWKAARKMFVKGLRGLGYLNVSRLEELYSPEVHTVLNDLKDRVRNSTSGDVIFSLNLMVQQATINAVFKMIFSRKPSQEDPLENRLAEMIHRSNDIACVGFSIMDVFPFLKYFPMLVPGMRENIKCCQAIYDIVSNERDRRVMEGSNHGDLMDAFLQEVDAHERSDPNYFTFQNVETTIRDLIMAGSDTIHVTIQHLILFMASNKAEQRKVQDEIHRVIGAHEFPAYEHSKRMIYTQAVIQETWRLGSVIHAAFRTSTRDCELGGLNIKKGTYLVPLYTGAHHSEELWEDPMSFKPSRFLSQCGSHIVNTDQTFTFSYGPRACPGELVGLVAVFFHRGIATRI